MRWLWYLALVCVIGTMPLRAEERDGEATALFADDSILEVTLTGPIGRIASRAQRSTEPHPATLAIAGETHAIELSARGVSRRKRENCQFPPLRIRTAEKAPEGSIMHRQGSVKLVTHCRDTDKLEQTLLREYTAYRLYNLVTPESLRVRLARVTYLDGDKVVAERLAFFIEDADDASRRLGLKEVDLGNIRVAALDRNDAARLALFQYMIGNTDWAMIFAAEGATCCHNTKLLGADKDATGGLTPVPYDFDGAGLVDAEYARPNAALGTVSVRTRVYRGFCAVNDLIPAEAEQLWRLLPALEAEIGATPLADAKTREEMLDYLAGFFRDIADDASLERKLLKACR
ncbi:hypothetical protein K3172_00630 [Qipengyuania sp. 6B39]|uniref:hypothetical protein n=1 Tax=Qipengyuania proteolytica TaxID=2867239 RepID=UPI001C89939C|nr:hypothetical protein [Qipengyuania proteolytica]MBX7494354.1 hypothetical protein [Qipengyuania proteolytica]